MKRCLLLLASLVLFSACAGPKEPPPRSIQAIDSSVVAMVRTNLKTDPELAVANVDVKAENNLLTLRGTVPNEAAKKRAEDIAQKSARVDKVANHLEVVVDANSFVP